jgi:methyltransferase (TIGR00027 family)
MKDDCPSATAMRVAMRRAAHQILDDPKIFDDPLALRILGWEDEFASQQDLKASEQTLIERGLRSFLAVRSRYAEDELHAAIQRGIRQYVILGAGLDTFAYRNPHPQDVLRVFEVDHPNTQNWKRACLEKAAIPIPGTLTFSPVDFETRTLEEGLPETGFNTDGSAFFSWLGVTQYLSSDAVFSTLQFVASLPAGSSIVFDYTLSPSLLNPIAREVFDRFAHRVAMAGEPFRSSFDPSLLKNRLHAMGFGQIEDLGHGELNGRYFQNRPEKSRNGGFTRVMNARVC